MRRVSAAGARKNFSSLVKKTEAGERIKVMRYNKTAAVLIPKRDLERLEDCEEEKEQQEEQDEPAAAAGSKRARAGGR